MSDTAKRLLLSGALFLAHAPQANADMTVDVGTNATATFYGQFDPAYLSFDDGVSRESEIVDNTNSNSRIGVWYRQPTDTGEFSINLETALGLRPSAGLDQLNTPDAFDWDRTDIRKVEAIWQDTRFGTVFVGQGSMSSDGASSQDLSGTTLVLYNSISDTAGAVLFRTTDGALSARPFAQSFATFDGARKARVRDVTPAFSGFSLSVSYGEEVLSKNVDDSVSDVAVQYKGAVGAVQMVGAVAYSRVSFENRSTRYDTIGSFSLLHDSGFNVTVAAGDRRDAGSYAYAKIGYKAEWFNVGTTAVAVDYYAGDDQSTAGSESASVGIGVVQSFKDANIDAYLGYRSYRLTEDAASYLDASSVLFGARWKF